jgi:uncharacterized OsmC-like protein
MATSKITYLGGLRTECIHIQSGQPIITDAPTDNHGRGEAFSPTDLTATSLGACIITTMDIAAIGRGIQLLGMEAEVTKVMAANPRRISVIVVNVTVHGDLTHDQQVILEDIGRNCPVAKSLHPDLKQELTFSFLPA